MLRLQDGTQVQLRSVVLNKYVSAANGGGSNVTVDRDVASTWETFRVRSTWNLLVWFKEVSVYLLVYFTSDTPLHYYS